MVGVNASLLFAFKKFGLVTHYNKHHFVLRTRQKALLKNLKGFKLIS
jgi:hypothetical protein